MKTIFPDPSRALLNRKALIARQRLQWKAVNARWAAGGPERQLTSRAGAQAHLDGLTDDSGLSWLAIIGIGAGAALLGGAIGRALK